MIMIRLLWSLFGGYLAIPFLIALGTLAAILSFIWRILFPSKRGKNFGSPRSPIINVKPRSIPRSHGSGQPDSLGDSQTLAAVGDDTDDLASIPKTVSVETLGSDIDSVSIPRTLIQLPALIQVSWSSSAPPPTHPSSSSPNGKAIGKRPIRQRPQTFEGFCSPRVGWLSISNFKKIPWRDDWAVQIQPLDGPTTEALCSIVSKNPPAPYQLDLSLCLTARDTSSLDEFIRILDNKTDHVLGVNVSILLLRQHSGEEEVIKTTKFQSMKKLSGLEIHVEDWDVLDAQDGNGTGRPSQPAYYRVGGLRHPWFCLPSVRRPLELLTKLDFHLDAQGLNPRSSIDHDLGALATFIHSSKTLQTISLHLGHNKFRPRLLARLVFACAPLPHLKALFLDVSFNQDPTATWEFKTADEYHSARSAFPSLTEATILMNNWYSTSKHMTTGYEGLLSLSHLWKAEKLKSLRLESAGSVFVYLLLGEAPKHEALEQLTLNLNGAMMNEVGIQHVCDYIGRFTYTLQELGLDISLSRGAEQAVRMIKTMPNLKKLNFRAVGSMTDVTKAKEMSQDLLKFCQETRGMDEVYVEITAKPEGFVECTDGLGPFG